LNANIEIIYYPFSRKQEKARAGKKLTAADGLPSAFLD